jgi:hypothetical protein
MKYIVVGNLKKIITFAVAWDETYDWVQAARYTRHDISANVQAFSIPMAKWYEQSPKN